MRLYAWGVAIAGWGLLLPLLDVTPPPPTSLLAIFLLLAVVTEWLMVPLPRGGFQSAGLAVSSAALVIMGPVHRAGDERRGRDRQRPPAPAALPQRGL